MGQLASQVKEVLPHVPLDVIRRDLGELSQFYRLLHIIRKLSRKLIFAFILLVKNSCWR